MKPLRLRWLLGIVLTCMNQHAHAQSCAATAAPINFGSVSPVALRAVDTSSSISVTCTWPSTTQMPLAKVCLNLGGASPRRLHNGNSTLQYDLYQDAARTLAWGSIYTGTTPISLTLMKPPGNTSATQVVTVYGRVAANQATVPSIGGSDTHYTETFSGMLTSLNAGFYRSQLTPLNCAAMTAGTGTFPFIASAMIVNNCTINASNLDFGSSGRLTRALYAVGNITARCTNSDAYRISLSGGSSNNVALRRMQKRGTPGVAIQYQLYLDAAHAAVWGDGTAGTSVATGMGTGSAQVLQVYGVVPAQTAAAPGDYSDTITATISF